jgi:hypothetical protein
MSYSTVLAVTPNRRPIKIAELRNSHGWSSGIWGRLMRHHRLGDNYWSNEAGLDKLWHSIETLPEWQQAPLVLTFDTGVIPFQAFEWTADQLAEFEKRVPAPENHVNHVPAVIEILRSSPEAPLIGVWGTSVSDNPFDPWDSEAEAPGSGIPLSEMYLLERHRDLVPA